MRPERWTTLGASGWGGDRYDFYEGPGGTATVLAVVWDTEGDAAEFEAALVPDAPRVRRRRGDVVVLAAASAGVPADALAEAALDSLPPPTPPHDGGADSPR